MLIKVYLKSGKVDSKNDFLLIFSICRVRVPLNHSI